MDMPTEDTPAEAYVSRSAYSISRVAADPKAAGHEHGLAGAHTDIKAALRERDDLQEEVERNWALHDVADEECDDNIEGYQLHLLAALKKNRDDIRYKRYFADGLRAVTTAEPRKEQPEIMADMIGYMAQDENDPDIGAVVQQWRPKFQVSRTRVVNTEQGLTAAEKALEYVKEVKLPALMAKWREEYKKLEGALLTVYPSNPKRVARCFKPFRKNRKATAAQAPVKPSTTP